MRTNVVYPNSLKYPKLMITRCEDVIVLMTHEGIGTVVYSIDPKFNLGDYEEDWNIDDFMNFNGTLELANE